MYVCSPSTYSLLSFNILILSLMKSFTNILRLLAFLVLGTSATILVAQPANNECAGAIGMTVNPNASCAVTTSVVTTGATLSTPVLAGGATFCAPTSGNDDVWYTFTTNAGQSGVILTVSNIVATTGTATTGIGYGVYSGTCASLTQLFCTASGITTTSSIGSLTPGTTYYLRTWLGSGGNSGTFTLCLQDPPTPPNCATNLAPASGVAPLLCPNATTSPSTVVFTWTAPASGPAPTGYKFYLAATPAAPALLGTVTGTTASVFNLLPSTTYSWYVVPTNGGDAVGCNTPLTFTTDVEPPCVANNTCATATMIGTVGNGGTVNSTTTGASISQAGEVCAAATGTADDDVWFKFTTDGDGGDVTVALTGADAVLDGVIIVYSGSCGALTNIGCADATVTGAGTNNETATVTGLAASTTYYARVYGYGAYSATTPTSGAFTLTTSGTGVAGALPLELKSFTGQVSGNVNLLSWETLTEKNVQFHIVERSLDGTRWSEVGRVAGKADSQVSVKYSLQDKAPLARAYYRLRSVDFDGKENLSSSIVLTRKGDNFGITSVYPSPTTSNVTVQFNSTEEEKVTVRVMDMTGRLVMEQVTDAIKDINELPITLTGLQSGVYSVTVSNSTTVSTPVRFVKQ